MYVDKLVLVKLNVKGLFTPHSLTIHISLLHTSAPIIFTSSLILFPHVLFTTLNPHTISISHIRALPLASFYPSISSPFSLFVRHILFSLPSHLNPSRVHHLPNLHFVSLVSLPPPSTNFSPSSTHSTHFLTSSATTHFISKHLTYSLTRTHFISSPHTSSPNFHFLIPPHLTSVYPATLSTE